MEDDPVGGGRGQILWVRGLTRLQQQVGPVCPLTLSPHPQPPTSLPVHLGCVPCCVWLQSDLYCVSVFVAFGFSCRLIVCLGRRVHCLCVYTCMCMCVCVLEMCLFGGVGGGLPRTCYSRYRTVCVLVYVWGCGSIARAWSHVFLLPQLMVLMHQAQPSLSLISTSCGRRCQYGQVCCWPYVQTVQ